MELTCVFKHYRIPDHCDLLDSAKKKGKPPFIVLLPYSRHDRPGWTPTPRGGKTVCLLQERDGDQSVTVVAEGIALCSMSDTFCYATGRRVAFLHALETFFRDDHKRWLVDLTNLTWPV